MYLVNTRPDICFTVNTLSQFMVEPKRVHWAAARHILRYVCGTVGFGLKYTREDDIRLCRFTDADWAGSSVDRKSTSSTASVLDWDGLLVQQEAEVSRSELSKS